MEFIEQIKQACMENNNVLIKDLLDSIGNIEHKKKAFTLIIDYYSKSFSFPVGYALLFIKELLLNQELSSAREQISRCRRIGVSTERLSGLVFEYLIKPNEAWYRENFERNLQLIRKHKILFTEHNFEFEQIKKKIILFDDTQPDLPDLLVQREGNTFFLIDVINMEIISESLQLKNFLYLMYVNLQKFYYLLFFKDFSGLSKYMERNLPQDFTRSLIVFFVGVDAEFLQKFFSNSLVLLPNSCINRSEDKTYSQIIVSMAQRKNEKQLFYKAELSEYYKKLTYQYYKRLFSSGASDIKVLLIGSECTELNKFIVKNWYNSFLELGYRAELHIESLTYEMMNMDSFVERMYEYRPDIVFMINWAVDDAFQEDKIKENLLWILRYRDNNFRTYNFNNNMFILPILPKMYEVLSKAGVAADRLLYTMDGIDTTLFVKKTGRKIFYACDVVSVNNSVGNEVDRLNFFVTKTNDKRVKEIMLHLYTEIKEKAFDDYFLSDSDILKMLSAKVKEAGIELNETLKDFFMWFSSGMISCFYRSKVIEWIMDSGITTNIKVWGGSWHRIEKFRNINMGLAKHGVELSEIYGNSKISLCDTWGWNMHERNFEILASGGFPLVKALEEDSLDKSDNITNYFKENEEIVLFYSKDDLLNKLQYYLDNPQERERIAENGRQVVLNNFSHTAIARKTMDFIKSYYLAEGKG